ncbi:MAG: hypothetical protein Q8936_12450 [Bacillota bacterium]|nr:hypothetical protein [Bacillota bacterium]
MNQVVINEIVIPVLVTIIGIILEIGRRQLRNYLGVRTELLDKQKQALQQSMDIERYNKDKQFIKDTVMTIEQLGKELDWEGSLKHSKVLDLVDGKTRLKDEEIYNIIKAAVAEINMHSKITVTQNAQKTSE